MTTAELKEYLQMMVDLERDLYTEQEMEESIRKKIAQCYISPPARTFEGYCRKRRYDASLPTLPSGEVPAKPSAPQKENFQVKDFRMSIGVFALTIFAGVIFPPCVIIVPLVVKHYRAKKSEALYNSALEEYVKQRSEYNKYAQAYVEAQRAYRKKQERNEQYYEAWKKEKEEYEMRSPQNALKRESYSVLLQKIRDQERRTSDSLHKLYVECNVYYKYRNLSAVCAFYDYIAAGICTKLEGMDGAYNKYDTEMRLNHIVTQLDIVIENLEEIRNNQNKLYSEMLKANNTLRSMRASMGRMEGKISGILAGMGAIYMQGEFQNAQLSAIRFQTEKLLESSELNAYLNGCNNRQLSYMNRMNYLAGHYDNPYGNYAPV